MTAVSWLSQHVCDVPPDDDWLSPVEREVLARFWAPKRIRDWRLGRWTGKRALAKASAGGFGEDERASWRRLSIVAAETGSPRVTLDEAELDWVISLSHSGEHGLAAIARRGAALGCDVETIGRRGAEFVIGWFTDGERRIVAAAPAGDERSRVVTLVWSAKESALKALGVGLRLDTREVAIEAVGAGAGTEWSPLAARAPDRVLHGWWRMDGERVMTVVADPAPGVPIGLASPSDHG